MSTDELINNIKDGDNVKANKAFDSLMKSKLNDSLDAKHMDIASSIGKSSDEPEAVEEPVEA